jgi:hypothetical protein
MRYYTAPAAVRFYAEVGIEASRRLIAFAVAAVIPKNKASKKCRIHHVAREYRFS